MPRKTESTEVISELLEIGRQTRQTLASRHQAYWFIQQRQCELRQKVEAFVARVHALDVSSFGEEAFVAVDAGINEVITAMEQHLTTDVAPTDTVQLHLIGEAIRALREARTWIVQGLSPDPSKRPSPDERHQLVEHASRDLLLGLLEDKDR